MTCFFWVVYRTRYCPFLCRISGELNANSPCLFIEGSAAWFNRQLQMLQVWLGEVFQTESLLLGSQDAANCPGSSQSSSVKETNICPRLWVDVLSWLWRCHLRITFILLMALLGLAAAHHLEVSVCLLTALLCQLCLICSVTIGLYSSLKARWSHQHFFSWNRWGSIHKVPSTGRAGAVGNLQHRCGDRQLGMVQLFAK